MNPFDLREDMHIHSTFSDGQATLEEIYEEATDLGLRRICLVDHVWASTTWVPEFVRAARRFRSLPGPEVFVGVEAKLLDAAGHLDLPPDLREIDFVLAADHQVPFRDGYRSPRWVREQIRRGVLTRREVVQKLIGATINAMYRYSRVVVAHPFSVLPKIGASEADVLDSDLRALAASAVETRSRFEVSERWRCPSARSARRLIELGARFHVSTDSHCRERIGRYGFCRDLSENVTTWMGIEKPVLRAG